MHMIINPEAYYCGRTRVDFFLYLFTASPLVLVLILLSIIFTHQHIVPSLI